MTKQKWCHPELSAQADDEGSQASYCLDTITAQLLMSRPDGQITARFFTLFRMTKLKKAWIPASGSVAEVSNENLGGNER